MSVNAQLTISAEQYKPSAPHAPSPGLAKTQTKTPTMTPNDHTAKPRRRFLRRAIIALVVAATPSLAIAGRERIVRLEPALAPVYAALGAPVNLRGLEFRQVTSKLDRDGARRLVIEGEIVNIKRTSLRAPDLRIAVLSAQGRELYHWFTPAPKERIEAGESVAFRASLDTPPAGAETIAIRFTDRATKTR